MDAVSRQVAALAAMTAKQLRERYREVFGEEATTGNAQWLRKRIAWRLQALAEGDLSMRARHRASELANDADLRVCVPQGHPVLGLVEPETDDQHEDEAVQERPVVAVPARPQIRLAVQREPEEEAQVQPAQPRDPRLPPVGTTLTRKYKGKVLQVKVLADGFEYEGQRYASLSAVAKHITGSHCNGFAFFQVGTKSKEAKR